MVRLLCAALLAVLIAGSTAASANVLVRMSYAQKFEAASLVIVGRAVRTLDPSASPYGRVIEVRVLSTLKGGRHRTIRVYGTSPIAEDELNCCTAGATYIMFLDRAQAIYESVNGHFGIIPVG